MTESGGTARFLSRFRSSVPIYALSRHDGSRRRMALMRDVFPIDFDSRGLATRAAARDAVQALHDAGLLAAGAHIQYTSGAHTWTRAPTTTPRHQNVGERESPEEVKKRQY